MASFKPSQVESVFIQSSFRKMETEIMAAHIVNYLAAKGDGWKTVIVWDELLDFMETAQMQNPAYNNPFASRVYNKTLAERVSWLVDRGFLDWAERLKSFTVTQKLISFYELYVLVELVLVE